MATIVIDGKEYPLVDGENLNVIQAATRAGVEITYFCWHPALSVVANCRMCEVEVGSKDLKTGEIKMIPKLVPACQTRAQDGTVVVTDSPKVKENQRMVMEYLLIHHPLDCPVCDQAGECSLQDFSFDYGQASHRYVEQRLVNPRKDVSDQIQLNQDRCIMCTRCVRFTREITQTAELGVIRRANRAEIDIFPGRPVDNPLAGNVVDLCPVGALLDKKFLHKQRVWYLTRHDAVCVRCSTGCNIYAEENVGRIWRFRPRFNPHVNNYWICDEGRYSYEAANDSTLLDAMYVRQGGYLRAVPVDQAIKTVGRQLEQIARDGGIIAGLLSPFLTVEEAYLMASYLKGLDPANVLALGRIPVRGEDVTFNPDLVTGRGGGNTSFLEPRPFTIHVEKCPNRRGVEAILAHFQGEVIDYASASEQIAAGAYRGLYVASGALDPWIDEDKAQALRSRVAFLVVQDMRPTPLAHVADIVLAGATFAEKAGCYVNADGRLQYTEAVLPPREGSLPDLDLLAILLGRANGPISSRDILAELAEAVPTFAAARVGRIPEFGVPLSGHEAGPPARRFLDPWLGFGQTRAGRVIGTNRAYKLGGH